MGMSMGMVQAAGMLALGLRDPLWHLSDAFEHTCVHSRHQSIEADQAGAIAPACSPGPLRPGHPRGRVPDKTKRSVQGPPR